MRHVFEITICFDESGLLLLLLFRRFRAAGRSAFCRRPLGAGEGALAGALIP
jgi:hypothetical protein